MMKLFYSRKADLVLTIDLHNKYSVVAFALYNFEKQNYTVSLSLKHNELDLIQEMDDFEQIELDATSKTISPAILKSIASLLSEGSFDNYINRYEYIMECFERGNAEIEKERCSNVD